MVDDQAEACEPRPQSTALGGRVGGNRRAHDLMRIFSKRDNFDGVEFRGVQMWETRAQILLATAILLVGSSAALAAKIERFSDHGKSLIFVQGSFVPSDVDDFKKLAVELESATVVFNSPGGDATVGTEIGRIISLRGYLTAVAPDAICASACALAWLAGQERLVWHGSKVGFHAVYTAPNGTPSVSSDGNALVGAYLRQLGFPDRTIVYVTQTSPSSIQWLTLEDAKRYGIPFTYIESAKKEQSATDAGNGELIMYGRRYTHIPVPSLLSRPDNDPVDPEQLQPLTGQSRAIFYEERLGYSPIAIAGSVEWRRSIKMFRDGVTRDFIEGEIRYPEQALNISIRIEPNDDRSLPASHVISLFFRPSLGRSTAVVASVPRVGMKTTEQERGDSLIAVPTRLTDYLHIIALNDDRDAQAKNLSMLKLRRWIDIPVVFADSTRALITLEKGAIGDMLFDSMLEPTEAAAN